MLIFFPILVLQGYWVLKESRKLLKPVLGDVIIVALCISPLWTDSIKLSLLFFLYCKFSLFLKEPFFQIIPSWKGGCTGSLESTFIKYHIVGKHLSLLICPLSEPSHEISNNVVCATSKGSDQPAHTRSLLRAIASRLDILWLLSYLPNSIWSS